LQQLEKCKYGYVLANNIVAILYFLTTIIVLELCKKIFLSLAKKKKMYAKIFWEGNTMMSVTKSNGSREKSRE
jgi:hypothetical protein